MLLSRGRYLASEQSADDITKMPLRGPFITYVCQSGMERWRSVCVCVLVCRMLVLIGRTSTDDDDGGFLSSCRFNARFYALCREKKTLLFLMI